VGNKKDLEKDLGVLINKKEILEVVYRYNLLEYIETSALTGVNIEKLFRKMAFLALMDLHSPPKLGQIIDRENFRFKIVLVGPAAVGKTTILRTLVDKEFIEQYKITVGLDSSTKAFEIVNEEISQEARESIEKAFNSLDKLIKKQKSTQLIETTKRESGLIQIKSSGESNKLSKKWSLKRKFNFIGLSIILICIIMVLIIIINSFN